MAVLLGSCCSLGAGSPTPYKPAWRAADARHMKAAVSAMPVKTDRIDARNIAFAMQVGWYRPVHLKRPEARKLRLLLASREMLVRMRIDLDNHIRGVLKAFGLKVGKVAAGQFEDRSALRGDLRWSPLGATDGS